MKERLYEKVLEGKQQQARLHQVQQLPSSWLPPPHIVEDEGHHRPQPPPQRRPTDHQPPHYQHPSYQQDYAQQYVQPQGPFAQDAPAPAYQPQPHYQGRHTLPQPAQHYSEPMYYGSETAFADSRPLYPERQAPQPLTNTSMMYTHQQAPIYNTAPKPAKAPLHRQPNNPQLYPYQVTGANLNDEFNHTQYPYSQQHNYHVDEQQLKQPHDGQFYHLPPSRKLTITKNISSISTQYKKPRLLITTRYRHLCTHGWEEWSRTDLYRREIPQGRDLLTNNN